MKTSNETKVKKINILYLLGYIFVPIIVCAICFFLSYKFFPKGTMAVILLMGPSLLSFIWRRASSNLLLESIRNI